MARSTPRAQGHGATSDELPGAPPADLSPADVAGEPGKDKPVRDASTVVLLRDAEGGPEVYMVQRHRGNKFMANAHVFVGGRVDDEDCAPALEARLTGRSVEARGETLGLGGELCRARGFYVAAVRESFEESGILLALGRDGRAPRSGPELTALRDALNEGEVSFGEVLERLELTIPLDRLRLLTHWVTPPFEVKRYDTLFFVARAPAGQEASFDPRETTAGTWCAMDELLEAHHREEIKLAPPTYCVLDDLRRATSVDEALAMTADEPVAGISPRILEGETALTFLMPDDHRFDDASSPGGREHYMLRRGSHWRRYRS